MPLPERLDNVDHHDLRVINRYGAAFGDDTNQVVAFPTEFAELSREYPIFFRPGDKGFYAVVILGLDAKENLYVQGDTWQARYIPAFIQRGPFLIGFQERNEDGLPQSVPVIHVDVEHPRISRTEGDPLFLPHGGNAPRLDHIAGALRVLHVGMERMATMFKAFEAEGLIAPVQVDIQLDDMTRYTIPELFSISADALAGLSGAALERLNRAGFLPLAFHVLNSTGNMQRLIEMKTRKRKGG